MYCFGDGLFYYVLPVYIRQLNASPADVGLLYSLRNLSYGVSIFLGGFFADRVDTKKFMILSSFLWIPVPLALAFATSWKQLWLPMILYGTYFEAPAICVYLLKLAPAKKIMHIFGIWSSSTAAGLFFSPLVGGVLYSLFGKQIMFIVASIFFAFCVLPLFFIRNNPRPVVDKVKNKPLFIFKEKKVELNKKLVRLTIFFTLIMFLVLLVKPLVPQLTNGVYHQSVFDLGIFGMMTSFGWICFSLAFASLGDRGSKMVAVTGSIAVSSFSFLFIALFNNFPFLCFASFLFGATGTLEFFMSGVIAATAPTNSVGIWNAISRASITFAGVSAPILGGILYEISPYLAFFATSSVLFLAVVLSLTSKLFN